MVVVVSVLGVYVDVGFLVLLSGSWMAEGDIVDGDWVNCVSVDWSVILRIVVIMRMKEMNSIGFWVCR